MWTNFRFLLIILSSLTIIIFFTTQQNLNLDSVNEKFFLNKFWLLKGSQDLLKSNFEAVKEENEVIYCEEEDVEDFGEEEEKVFSNRNLFDHLTRQLEHEVLRIMTSASPCSTTSSSSSSTSSPLSKPSSTTTSPTSRKTSLPGGSEHQQTELQNFHFKIR